MKRTVRLISIIMCFVMITTCTCFGASLSSYADASNHWAKGVLERAVSDNILNGSNGNLYPDGNLKGSEMSAIMVRQLNLQSYDRPYPGTSPSDWYYKYAAIAAKSGIVDPADGINMNTAVTREQVFITFVNAYFGKEIFEKPEADAGNENGAKPDDTENQDQDTTEPQENGEDDKNAGNGENIESHSENGIEIDVEHKNEHKDEASEADKAGADVNEKKAPLGIDRFSDSYLLSAKGRKAAEKLYESGLIKGDDRNMLNPSKSITRAEFVTMLYRAADSTAPAVKGEGISIRLEGGDVPAGAPVRSNAYIVNADGAFTGDIQWSFDGVEQTDTLKKGISIDNGFMVSFEKKIEFTKYMNLFRRVGFDLSYVDADGVQHHKYAERVMKVINYPASHYGVSYEEAKSKVSCVYKGNYTSSYNIDYDKDTKEAFVSVYSSKTPYLVWVNLATQKVNVFMGSKGSWKLAKTFRCASGARKTPTPTGVTYVTYKQAAWKTSSYICKPIVRFYPGTGYAFHSVLLRPDGSGRIKDGSMGFPVSHGCIRMMPADIQWIYDYVPVNSTVVIY